MRLDQESKVTDLLESIFLTSVATKQMATFHDQRNKCEAEAQQSVILNIILN